MTQWEILVAERDFLIFQAVYDSEAFGTEFCVGRIELSSRGIAALTYTARAQLTADERGPQWLRRLEDAELAPAFW